MSKMKNCTSDFEIINRDIQRLLKGYIISEYLSSKNGRPHPVLKTLAKRGSPRFFASSQTLISCALQRTRKMFSHERRCRKIASRKTNQPIRIGRIAWSDNCDLHSSFLVESILRIVEFHKKTHLLF